MSEEWVADQPFASVVERARAFEPEALALLYDRYLPVVYRYALGATGDPHLAEDLAAETMLAMVESVGRVRADDERAFAAWLLGIARRKAAAIFRRRAARPVVRDEVRSNDEPAAGADAGDPLGVVVARERWGEVAAALRQLTEEQRTVVVYRCVLGYDTEDVARLIGRQPGAVRALQFRALSSLARFLVAAHASIPNLLAVRAGARRGRRPEPGREGQG